MNCVRISEKYTDHILTWNLRQPVLQQSLQILPSLSGLGLDLGCCIGQTTKLLIDISDEGSSVVGMDIDPASIEIAQLRNAEAGKAKRLRFLAGDGLHLPWDEPCFDWAGAIDVAGAPGLDPKAMLGEMARVVKPGGTVFLLNWSSQLLLPGYPVLEARLNQTASGLAPYSADMPPDLHITRALGWFEVSLFCQPSAITTAGSVTAPLDDDIRQAMTRIMRMRWTPTLEELGYDLYREYKRLCRPESPDFILNRSDYYAYFTYTLFYACRLDSIHG